MKVLVAVSVAISDDIPLAAEHIRNALNGHPFVAVTGMAFGQADISNVYPEITDKILVPVTMTDEQCGDIIETTLTSGASWINSYRVVDRKPNVRQPVCDWVKQGHAIELSTDEGKFIVTPHDIRRGVRMFLDSGETLGVDIDYREKYETSGTGTSYKRVLEVPELDMGNIDANDADSILQYAVYGELVYS